MFGIAIAALVIIALLSILGEIVMRIRLTRAESSSEKLLWWRRGGDNVADAYQELYPSSRLPALRKIVFWAFLAICITLLLVVVVRRA